ncbi:Crp/Fnr family transcriptional regulator [Tenacibaculum caenipelagi]|uniref:CRP-like cAMP-binding protein n=1 Tax=Tenacibaculum caenipelagi TaxID=1325435 RepID=A0A4R6THR0_9FLAO|nr:Crp/Fnr family transcriptional regulator [Tenacibaculum caenipelagi]TDQ28726.1 CRP-like cAMP-binding protein [Tenacibaculum caenipelagi]
MLHINNFIPITSEDIDFMLPMMAFNMVKKNEMVLTSGNICNHLFFITKGCLKKYYINTEGKERVFSFATEMQWVGDMNSLWKKEKTIFDIKALEDTEFITISKNNLEILMDESLKFNRYFRSVSYDLIYKLERRVNQCLSCSAEERYGDFIMDYKNLEQRISQKEIASFLGITPEFLSVLRRKKK